MMEQDRHVCTSFVTLTYDEEHLPPDGSLRKRDLQLYLKRLRRRLPFRFFAAGEYGERGGASPLPPSSLWSTSWK